MSTSKSIAAYDVSQRVKTYDADMELMHPNRSKMVQVAIEVLPFPRTAALRAIDLGIGTGYFTKQFLNHFPNSRVLGIDGAQAMVELAKARLKIFGVASPIRHRRFSKPATTGSGRRDGRCRVFCVRASPPWPARQGEGATRSGRASCAGRLVHQRGPDCCRFTGTREPVTGTPCRWDCGTRGRLGQPIH